MIALSWIKGTSKEFKQFVQNRVVEIRKLVSVRDWRFCPGLNNPADIVSRGMLPSELSQSKLWWNGPDFLVRNDSEWSKDGEEIISINDEARIQSEREVKSKPTSAASLSCANDNVTEKQSQLSLQNILPKERYSTLCKLLRVTSYVLRFIANLRTKVAGTEPNLSRLSLEEITEAKHIWYKHIQGAIQTSKSFKQVQASLGLFKDNCGIWRCGGRLSNANIELSAKHPVFLPNYHWFSTLLVEECHRRVMHNGVRETLCEIRSEHWIAKGRQFVKKIIAKCTTCKRYEGGTSTIITRFSSF